VRRARHVAFQHDAAANRLPLIADLHDPTLGKNAASGETVRGGFRRHKIDLTAGESFTGDGSALRMTAS
jgi:hypothetical protein